MSILKPSGAAPNLLPPSFRLQRARRRQRFVLMAAAAALMGAFVPPIAFLQHRAAQRREWIAQAEIELTPLRLRQRRNEQHLAQLAEATRQILVLREAYAARTSWLALLGELQDQLQAVEDVWLDTLRLVRPEAHATRTMQGLRAAVHPTGKTQRLTEAPPSTATRLVLSGRLLEVHPTPESVGEDGSLQRVKQLLTRLAASPFVNAVEDQRFDTGQHGRVTFEVTLVVNPGTPL